MLSILMKPLFDAALKKMHINPKSALWILFQMLRTFIIVCVGYVFDIAPSFRQAIWTFKRIIINQSFGHFLSQVFNLGINILDLLILTIGSALVLLVSIYQEKKRQHIRVILDKKNFWVRYVTILFLLTVILVFGLYDLGNATATFVYAQF